MQADLNDMLYFARVVEFGGFNAASRQLGIPKSRLSRRVAGLEQRLGVRLLQRTTRKLALTAAGAQYLQHCQAMLEEAQAAEEVVARMVAAPRGLVRVSCPELLAKLLLAPLLPRFMQQYPEVRLALEVTGRRVDLVEEGIDIALRVRQQLDDNASEIARPLSRTTSVLVASADFLAARPVASLAALANVPALVMSRPDGKGLWQLQDEVGQLHVIQIEQPVLMTDDLLVLLQAAIAGCGVAVLPEMVCRQALKHGLLQQLLPGFSAPGGTLYACYIGRRHLVPGVRAVIDFLLETVQDQLEEASVAPLACIERQ